MKIVDLALQPYPFSMKISTLIVLLGTSSFFITSCQYIPLLGKKKKAQKYYQQSLSILHNHTNYVLSDSLSSKALELADKAITLNPKVSDYYRAKGAALEHKKKYNESIMALNKAVMLDSNNYLAWMCRGNSFEGLKKYDNSEHDYLKALSINKNSSGTWYNLAILYNKRGETKKAITAYDRSIEIHENSKVLNNRATLKIDLQLYNEALEDLNRAIELAPMDKQPLNNRGFCYFLLKEYDKSLKDLLNYLKIAEDDSFKENYNTTAIVHNNIANCYYHKGEMRKACTYWKAAIKKGYKFQPQWKDQFGIDNPIDLLKKHCLN